MNKTYHFLSGLPRSGSTVIASILNQNPEVYVTPTSPMLNVAVEMQTAWANDPTVKANYFEEQINNLTKAILPAFWEHRPEPIIIDKGRGWAKNMINANKLFNKEIKVLVIERDLPSIMASWLTLIRAQQSECQVDSVLRERGYPVDDEHRMGELWFNMVKDCIEGLVQIKREVPDQIIVVDYDDFMLNPYDNLDRIGAFLELPNYDYDINNIVNDTADDDMVAWGFNGLHTIRPKLGDVSSNPKEVLGDMLYNRFVEIEKQYREI
jgi:sulfotransferase